MTLKGRQNHYNVKFLKGYGFSIRQKNNQIVLTNGKDPFSESQSIESYFIPQFPYEKGQKRCNSCDIYVEWDGFFCPCCGMKLRVAPRHKKWKEKVLNFSRI